MSSAKSPKFWHLLAFRLTLWYGGVFAVFALVCLLLFYWLTIASMRASVALYSASVLMTFAFMPWPFRQIVWASMASYSLWVPTKRL